MPSSKHGQVSSVRPPRPTHVFAFCLADLWLPCAEDSMDRHAYLLCPLPAAFGSSPAGPRSKDGHLIAVTGSSTDHLRMAGKPRSTCLAFFLHLLALRRTSACGCDPLFCLVSFFCLLLSSCCCPCLCECGLRLLVLLASSFGPSWLCHICLCECSGSPFWSFGSLVLGLWAFLFVAFCLCGPVL